MASKQKLLKVDKSARGKKSGSKVPVKSSTRSSTVQRAPVAIKPFPIAGLGASADGLEALEKFLSHVPPDCGIAFIVVTYLHPGHVSLLPELLGKCTRRPVRQAADGLVVEPGAPGMILLAIEEASAGRDAGKPSRRKGKDAAA